MPSRTRVSPWRDNALCEVCGYILVATGMITMMPDCDLLVTAYRIRVPELNLAAVPSQKTLKGKRVRKLQTFALKNEWQNHVSTKVFAGIRQR
jgi:hypothetical protein